MQAVITTSRPFLNLKDSDLQKMFGILINDGDNAAQRRYKINQLREKIGKAGITMRKLGDEEGVLINDIVDQLKVPSTGTYIPKRKYSI